MAGKHHGLDHPMDLGFDRYYGLRDGACNYFNPGLQREGEDPPAQKSKKFQPRTWCIDEQVLEPYTPIEKDFYTTDYFTNYALKYLEEYQDEENPFFLYLAYNAPHDPLQAWPDDIAKYRGKYMAGFEAVRKTRYKRQKEMGLIDTSFPLSDPTYRDWEQLTDEEKEKEDHIMSVYAAMIDRMDQNIGRVLDKIRQMGELNNTLVLFASDNGCAPGGNANPRGYNEGATTRGEIGSMARWTKITKSWSNVSNTPFRLYKVQAHKGGTCTPLIVYWPSGIKGQNRINKEVGHFIDIMPTILEVTDTDYPTKFESRDILPMQGRSLLPAIQQLEIADRDPIFWQYSKGKAVRKSHWRLVSDNNEPWALYDMRNDKTETNNLVERHPEIAQELENLYENWVNNDYDYKKDDHEN
jgi:arylsulfatase